MWYNLLPSACVETENNPIFDILQSFPTQYTQLHPNNSHTLHNCSSTQTRTHDNTDSVFPSTDAIQQVFTTGNNLTNLAHNKYTWIQVIHLQ